jgi:hypothetical protein
MKDADLLVSKIRLLGSDARDLRDAAHEAHHALDAGVPHGKWDRETIHRRLTRGRNPGDLLAAELGARAVEQIVCTRLRVECGEIEKWAAVAWMEALKNSGIQLPEPDWIAARVREWMTRPRIVAAAEAVLALRDYEPKRKSRSRRTVRA